jgi:hypothetical protein
MNVTRAKTPAVTRVARSETVVTGAMTTTKEMMTQVWILAGATVALVVGAGLYMLNPG